VWTRPREREAVQPHSRWRARRSPCGLLVNKPGSRQAGSRRLKARSNPRAEVVVRSDGLAPYLGAQSGGTREGKSPSCARSDLHHLGQTEFLIVLRNGNNVNQLASALQSLAQPKAWTGTASQLAAALNAFGLSPSFTAARLSIQLHKFEPELWWRHGLAIRFSRTSERRLICLAKRDAH
jgi:hypothetical protein